MGGETATLKIRHIVGEPDDVWDATETLGERVVSDYYLAKFCRLARTSGSRELIEKRRLSKVAAQIRIVVRTDFQQRRKSRARPDLCGIADTGAAQESREISDSALELEAFVMEFRQQAPKRRSFGSSQFFKDLPKQRLKADRRHMAAQPHGAGLALIG